MIRQQYLDTEKTTGWILSKVVIAAAGESIRTLAQDFDAEIPLPNGITNVKFVAPGILAVSCAAFETYDKAQTEMVDWANSLKKRLMHIIIRVIHI